MNYFNPTNFSTENLKFTNDTLINTLVYKKVMRSIDAYQQSWSDFGFIREDPDKRIFYKLNATDPEYLFYNFNIQLFDTITAYTINTFATNFFIQPQTYFVVSVDSALIGETFRKRINLGVIGDSTYSLEHWIDSTGNTGGLLHNNSMLVGRDSYGLLCFSEDGIVKYHMPGFDSCYIVTGLDNKQLNEMRVKIVPNPITDNSTLILENTNGEDDFIIDIYDVPGSKVCSKTFKNNLPLTRNAFQPGIYFYQIRGESGFIGTGKIVIN
jgi:hypothetical protein